MTYAAESGRAKRADITGYLQTLPDNPELLAGKMRISKRVFAKAGLLPGFFVPIWRMHLAAFETPQAVRLFRLGTSP